MHFAAFASLAPNAPSPQNSSVSLLPPLPSFSMLETDLSRQ